jgi:DNA-binding LacI/PurR family transcriptional regulator
MVTQAEIAKIAGVTRGTVSRVFNFDKRISAETTKKVLEVAEQLGYVHPRLSRIKNTLTVIVCAGSAGTKLAEGCFFMETFRGISDFCKESGYTTRMVSFSYEQNHELVDEFTKIIDNSESAGYILPSVIPVNEGLLEPFFRARNPLVLVNRYLDSCSINCVVNDDVWVGRTTAKFFLKKGHCRIGYIGGPLNATAMRDRFCGFREVLIDGGVYRPEYCSFHKNLTMDAGYQAMSELIQAHDNITSVFCCNDESALGAIRAIKDLGLRVPHDLSVIGHDGFITELDGNLVLTTFKLGLYDLGYQAAKLVVLRIENPGIIPQQIVIRPEFRIGNTVCSMK